MYKVRILIGLWTGLTLSGHRTEAFGSGDMNVCGPVDGKPKWAVFHSGEYTIVSDR